MKYNWTLRRFWWSWFKQDIKRWCYTNIHKFNMGGMNGTILPITGKGKFVSVYTKGKIIQIKHEEGYPNLEYDEIRLIPYQPNHGIMVETFKDGKMFGRNLLDIRQFNKSIIFASNVEELAKPKKQPIVVQGGEDIKSPIPTTISLEPINDEKLDAKKIRDRYDEMLKKALETLQNGNTVTFVNEQEQLGNNKLLFHFYKWQQPLYDMLKVVDRHDCLIYDRNIVLTKDLREYAKRPEFKVYTDDWHDAGFPPYIIDMYIATRRPDGEVMSYMDAMPKKEKVTYNENEVIDFAQKMIMQYKSGNTNIEQIDLLKESIKSFKTK